MARGMADNLRKMREAKFYVVLPLKKGKTVIVTNATETVYRNVDGAEIRPDIQVGINEQTINEQNKRTPGRPKKWASDAERMRARRNGDG